MNSLSFPDVNVWLALIWSTIFIAPWHRSGGGKPAPPRFTPLTQMSVPRLLTTAAAMWRIYDRLLADECIVLFPEPAGVEAQFRRISALPSVSPKVWADAFLSAFAACHGGQLVTFDRALANRGAHCVVLG